MGFFEAKKVFESAKAWRGLIGAKGYMNERGKLSSAECSFRIHHQPYEGAANYHNPPKEFVSFLNKAAMRLFENIYSVAIVDYENHLKEEAKKAVSLANEILEAAGELNK
jgi:hypothetical protein